MGKRQEKTRIDVSAPLDRSGLHLDPFAALNSLQLPPGPPTEEACQLKDDPGPVAMKGRGRVILRRETSQRGGKTVIVVSGFDALVDDAAIHEMARAVRKACGCGGTVHGREIEVQGDQPARVADFFRRHGFRVAGVLE